MEFNRRNAMIMYGAGVGLLGPLALVLDAASKDVQVAVAFSAIGLLLVSYMRLGVLSVRSVKAARASGDKQVDERTRRRMVLHFPVMVFAPFVVLAAHPWGDITVAIAAMLTFVPHMLYMHVMLIVGFAMKRRERKAPPADGGTSPA